MNTKTMTTQIAALLLVLLPTLCFAAQTAQPTADEQVLLERINVARVQQAEESQRLHLDFQEGMSYPVASDLQPLVWRSGLQAAAAEHNQDMWLHDYYGHVTPDGRGPFQQVLPHDADFLAVGQDLGAGRMYSTPDSVYAGWMIDNGIENRGHRQCILHAKIDSFGAQRSSVANTFYGVYWTAYFGVSLSQKHHVTGVIYHDLNRNGRYDAGEGLAHWKVRLVAQSPKSQPISSTSAVESDATGFEDAFDTGGYAVEVPEAGAYTVEAVSPDGQSYFNSADAGDENVKVDFVMATGHAEPVHTTGGTPSGKAQASGRSSGCNLTGGRSQTAWTLLAAMGLLVVAMLGLRIGSR